MLYDILRDLCPHPPMNAASELSCYSRGRIAVPGAVCALSLTSLRVRPLRLSVSGRVFHRQTNEAVEPKRRAAGECEERCDPRVRFNMYVGFSYGGM